MDNNFNMGEGNNFNMEEESNFTSEAVGISKKREPKKSPVKFIVAGIIALVVIIAAILIISFTTGAFGSTPKKIQKAIANTFKDSSQFFKDLDYTDIIDSGKYTISVNMDMDGEGIDLSLMNTKSQKGMDATIKTGTGIDVNMLAVLDKEELRVSLPDIMQNTVFTYNYKKTNNGFLAQALEEEGLSIDVLNEAIEAIYEGMDAVDDSAAVKEIKERKYSKIDAKSYEIDGKQVSCKGYETVIKGEEIASAMNEIKTALEGQDIDFSYEDVEAMLQYIDELKIKFYIYKDRLAAVGVEIAGSTIELQFRGGERRTQNMALVAEGFELLTISGSVTDKVENTTLSMMGQEIASFTYDTKDGYFDLAVQMETLGMDSEGEVFNIAGVVTSDREKVMADISGIGMDGEYMPLMVGFSVRSGADIPKLEGEEFDIGNAGESDLLKLAY